MTTAHPRPFTLPETPLSRVMCANGLEVILGHDGLWRSQGCVMTAAEVAEHAVRVVSVPGGTR